MVLYFAYGSNLWLAQMARRCPESSYACVGVLKGYQWVISARGYANVIESPLHNVYGALYSLSESDEASLDSCEGVDTGNYNKLMLNIMLEQGTSPVLALVYVDPIAALGEPKREYIMRINSGLEDANLPTRWVQENIRPFVCEA